jgi:poly-gamma-glutamate synthesis protein (capsule biosynthesis protein)
MHTARGYVEMAEAVHGPIPKPVDAAYIWGEALDAFGRVAPDVRIINLETAVTTSEAAWPGKGIHYRVHPENISCLTVAKIDCCVLSNNHVLDWGYTGLIETLERLQNAGMQTVGAGRNRQEAAAPAIVDVAEKGRVIVLGLGDATSGIPRRWAATADQPGVNWLPDLSDRSVQNIASQIKTVKREGDIVVASIHWGGNWGYSVSREQTSFAHQLVDEAGVDVVHGHSSHHAKGIEVYQDKPILYGCGDFLNDYEGIGGYEAFRADLALMIFVTMQPRTGKLNRVEMVPMQIQRFRAHHVTQDDARWLQDRLNREDSRFGTRVELHEDHILTLHWDEGDAEAETRQS